MLQFDTDATERQGHRHPGFGGSFKRCGSKVRQKGPRFHKRKFVRPARLSGGRGGVLGPLRTPKVIAVGKGPILEKHTPAPDRLRGGGGSRFAELNASDHTAIVG